MTGHPRRLSGTRSGAVHGPAAPPHRCRLAPGQLCKPVLAHLRAHPELALSPVELSNVLHRPNSRNTISRICRRLVTDGLARQTQQAPQRFQAIPRA